LNTLRKLSSFVLTIHIYTDEEEELLHGIVTQGYKKLSLKYHPDVGGTDEMFKLLGSLKERLMGT